MRFFLKICAGAVRRHLGIINGSLRSPPRCRLTAPRELVRLLPRARSQIVYKLFFASRFLTCFFELFDRKNAKGGALIRCNRLLRECIFAPQAARGEYDEIDNQDENKNAVCGRRMQHSTAGVKKGVRLFHASPLNARGTPRAKAALRALKKVTSSFPPRAPSSRSPTFRLHAALVRREPHGVTALVRSFWDPTQNLLALGALGLEKNKSKCFWKNAVCGRRKIQNKQKHRSPHCQATQRTVFSFLPYLTSSTRCVCQSKKGGGHMLTLFKINAFLLHHGNQLIELVALLLAT